MNHPWLLITRQEIYSVYEVTRILHMDSSIQLHTNLAIVE